MSTVAFVVSEVGYRYTSQLARTIGYGTSREDGPESELGREILGQLESPRPPSHFDVDGTDVLYVVGGHGWIFRSSPGWGRRPRARSPAR
jgi:hypothetical protein